MIIDYRPSPRFQYLGAIRRLNLFIVFQFDFRVNKGNAQGQKQEVVSTREINTQVILLSPLVEHWRSPQELLPTSEHWHSIC